MRYFLLLICFNFSVQAQFILDKNPSISENLTVDTSALCDVARNTLDYMNRYPDDIFAVHDGKNVVKQSSLARVKETLKFVCQLPVNKLSPTFLAKNFDFIRWYPDKKQANFLASHSENKVKKRLLNSIPEDKIFLTKYYTKLLNASTVQTKEYSQALYQLPFDEQNLSIEQAQQKSTSLTRFKYTRQQILTGILHRENLAKPIIWLSEEALHDVLLQGTGVVEVDGQRRYFNVHRNNGIAYDYTLGKREQARYWYFSEVPNTLGYGTDIDNKISISANVSFAGNVKQLGLGKLFLVQMQQGEIETAHLGVLADQGGAFDDNLFQLDWLKGSYFGWTDYYQANKQYSDYATAWLLLKKQ